MSQEVVLTLLASSGFWSLIISVYTRMQSLSVTHNKKDVAVQGILKGLAHDSIIMHCEKYIERGYIYDDEFRELCDYLYNPYKELGGNGSAERAIEEVKKLPLKDR